MFFETDQIDNILKCAKCELFLQEPKILPCGDTVCSDCCRNIFVKEKNKFQCITCSKIHTIPENGLADNSLVSELLLVETVQVSRGKTFETFEKSLERVQQKHNSLLFSINNREDKIKENCFELRSQVQLVTEKIISQILKQTENFSDEILKSKGETLASSPLKLNLEAKNGFIETVKQLKSFYSEWTDYLRQAQINDEEISNANIQASQLNEKANTKLNQLNGLIFGAEKLALKVNPDYLQKSLLGSFKIERITGIDSQILDDRESFMLTKMCKFRLNQKWELIYRATQDGFDAADFHTKCDWAQNTFVIVLSDNKDFVFGGYTEQSWSGQGFKRDVNAFIFSFINEHGRPVVIQCQKPDEAINCDQTTGPQFGKNDLRISGSQQLECSSSIGLSYRYSFNMLGFNDQYILNGKHSFKPKEIEVFTCINL